MERLDRALSAVKLTVTAILSVSPQPVWVRVGSALLWVCALDEQFRSDSAYNTSRNVDIDGRVIPGMRFARDRAAHGIEVITSEGGLRYPLFADGTLDYSPKWMPRNSMQTAPPGDRREQVDSFDNYLIGASVYDTFNAAVRWFERVQENGWATPKRRSS
jgi:hypothetical protein